MDYSRFPKVELHLHLDCSLSFDVVQQLDPSITFEDYHQSFIAPAKCTDLADYITRAIKGFELMQTKESLRLVTMDLIRQLKADNVIYAEIRFAPLQHLLKGLTAEEVIAVVNEAVSEGIRQTDVEVRIILCTLRHYTAEESMQTIKLVEQFQGTNVVAFDIAADEAGFPIDNHIAAFDYAKTNSIPCTAHAGEAKGAESVWETLEHFHPSRIGHGVRSVEDPSLLEFLKQKNIHLEVCPTSNIQVNVFETIMQHPANEIYESGVSMSVNTDARTISDTTLAKEYHLLENAFGWKKEHFLKCNLEAVDHAFVDSGIKDKLKSRLLKGYA